MRECPYSMISLSICVVRLRYGASLVNVCEGILIRSQGTQIMGQDEQPRSEIQMRIRPSVSLAG